MNEQGNAEDLTEEIQWKLGQFIRVLMSYVDFQQAQGIASYILENNLHDRLKPLLEQNLRGSYARHANNSGLVVGYVIRIADAAKDSGLLFNYLGFGPFWRANLGASPCQTSGTGVIPQPTRTTSSQFLAAPRQ